MAITAPTNGATVQSPVLVTATGKSTSAVTAMQIYVDHVLQTTIKASALSTYLALAPGSHTIVVKEWDRQGTNTMASLTVTVAASTPSTGRQLYVAPSGSDSGDGSVTRPWHTLSHADANARPGDVIHVAAGTYPSSAESGARLKTVNSGTAQAPIVWVSDTKWTAKITSTVTGNNAAWWSAGNYVQIQGFEITGSGALGIYNTGSHTRIIGNHIHDIPATGCPTAGGAGIHDGNYAASDDDVIGNWVHDIGDPSHPCARVHGIYHANLRGHIQNNVVYRNQGWGIHTWHAASNLTISGNTVFANGWGGIIIGATSPDFPSGSGLNDYTVVTDNIVYRNGLSPNVSGYGIDEYGDLGTHNQYQNNLVTQNGPADWHLFATVAQGNISTAPAFVNYLDNGLGDYTLLSTSPAVGAGTSVGAPAQDFRNGPRPTGSRWDIGAYQYAATPGVYPQP
ncbi:MAG TPA: choice-of-anchor Q domain-containing protein [Terriglobales bacterium]